MKKITKDDYVTYGLYHDKKTLKIAIIRNPKLTIACKYSTRLHECDDNVRYFNDNYFYSSNRKALKEKAINIKNIWINEAKEKLEIISKIKIGTK